MKKLLLTILLTISLTQAVCFAAEETAEITQNIQNLKGFASINLDSQIKPESEVKKQRITNDHSAFNININRNTYKFYCEAYKDETKKE